MGGGTTVTDWIWLIHSDFSGHPQAGGKAFHGIRWSTNQHMTVPDQMHDGGHFLQSDCLVAITQVILYDYLHISVSGLTLEGDEQTTSGGTLFEEVVKALAMFGIQSHIEKGDPPPGGWLGNPAWKGLIPPNQDGPYRTASAGVSIVIDSSPNAPPTPTPQGEDNMGASFVTPDGKYQARFWVGPDHHIYESWYDVVAGKWNGPVPLPGASDVAGGLSASVDSSGDQLVFWTGNDGHQHELWYAGGKWNGPVALPRT